MIEAHPEVVDIENVSLLRDQNDAALATANETRNHRREELIQYFS